MRKARNRTRIIWGFCLALASICGAQEPDSIRAFGDHLFQQGDYYRAITEYERFVFLAPERADAGEVRLKNILRPLRVFRLASAGSSGPAASGPTAPTPAGVALPPRELPSLAVLPFQNMSGDPEQESDLRLRAADGGRHPGQLLRLWASDDRAHVNARHAGHKKAARGRLFCEGATPSL